MTSVRAAQSFPCKSEVLASAGDHKSDVYKINNAAGVIDPGKCETLNSAGDHKSDARNQTAPAAQFDPGKCETLNSAGDHKSDVYKINGASGAIDPGKCETLNSAGITQQQASEYERLAKLPDAEIHKAAQEGVTERPRAELFSELTPTRPRSHLQ